jgi:outer membrane protein assembly factor BamB
MKAPVLQLSTPVAVHGYLYTIDSKGVFYRIRARDGQISWSEKLKGKYHSSPLYADGHIYVSSTRGETLVYEEGPMPKNGQQKRAGGRNMGHPCTGTGCPADSHQCVSL